MRRLIVSTYATNAAQMVNMTFFALVLPLSIGFEQYGIYVSLYALPGLLQGMIETMYTVHLSRTQFTRGDLRTWTVLTAVGAVAVTVGYRVLSGDASAFYAAIILIALAARGLVTALLYACRSVDIVRQNVIAEVLTAVVYILILTVGDRLRLQGFEIPLAMMLISQFVCIVYLGIVLRRHGVTPVVTEKRFDATVFRFALSRAYEDLLFTFQPLSVAMFVGNAAAGQYRYMVSVTKALSKVFPLRYEILSRHEGTIDRRALMALAGLSTVAGLVLFGVFRSAETYYPVLRNPASIMLAASGITVFVTTFLPLVARESPRFVMQVLPLALVVVVAPAIGGLGGTSLAFLACNVVAFVLMMVQMLGVDRKVVDILPQSASRP
jgi:hypothetical protein